MKKKTELKVGDIYQVPKTLDVRVINLWKFGGLSLSYNDIGGHLRVCRAESFRSWITRKKAVLIGHYDFETGKAVKGGKR